MFLDSIMRNIQRDSVHDVLPATGHCTIRDVFRHLRVHGACSSELRVDDRRCV